MIKTLILVVEMQLFYASALLLVGGYFITPYVS